jgi:hypothetical protein
MIKELLRRPSQTKENTIATKDHLRTLLIVVEPKMFRFHVCKKGTST